MIGIDKSARSVLAHCAQCPSFRELRGTRPAALIAAATHVELVHGDARAAANLRDRARHAQLTEDARESG